uniref:hypothetical protein n=1 Tax=Paractinoplanes polyasparticus TaxID=2856853 RepID=UPI001C85F2CC|nr:hypothetical protein [Actinoplanes polyasparticus]
MSDETITLEAERTSRTTITVNRAEYEQAKADNRVDHLLDVYLSDMDGETTITEPDGTIYDPSDVTRTWRSYLEGEAPV